MSFDEYITYINKILNLRDAGFDVIENVDFELVEDDPADTEIMILE